MTTPASSAPTSSAPSDSSAPQSGSEGKIHSSPPPSAASGGTSSAKVPEGQKIVDKNMPNAEKKESVFDKLPGEQKKEASEPKKEETPAAAEKKAEEEIKKEIRKHKLKINGQEREYTEEEVIRKAQLSEAADEKFKSASEKMQQMERFIEALKTNPKAVLSHPDLGINMRQLAEDYLTEEVKRDLMSPEERELNELREFKRKQDEASERSKKEQLTKAQHEQMQALQQRQRENFDNQISDVLKKSNLPKTAETVKRVAEVLYSAVSKGYELDVATAVDLVKENYIGGIQSLVGNLDGDALLSILGNDIAKKIRQHDLNRLKAKIQPQQAQQAADVAEVAVKQVSSRRDNSTNQKLSESEWKEMIRKKAGL
jgi:hypothetical protein